MSLSQLEETLRRFLNGRWAGAKRLQGLQGGAIAYVLGLAAEQPGGCLSSSTWTSPTSAEVVESRNPTHADDEASAFTINVRGDLDKS